MDLRRDRSVQLSPGSNVPDGADEVKLAEWLFSQSYQF
jgi:hypothetical protein